MTHNDSQVEAVMALVEEYGQSKWCEGLADGVFDRRGSRDYADAAAEEFAAIRTALSALAAGKVEAIPLPLTDAQMLLAWMDETFGNDSGTDWLDEDAAAVGDALNKAVENFKRMRSAIPSPLSADPESAVVGAAKEGQK